ncbi:MAG: GNAT family N-acetyltransferase [Clostridia bacterium]|nr:GNAT family N-acetyltransferase [Clostridia bacterium]
MKNINIRKITSGDAKTLAYIQTESWKAAFKNIIPDDLLTKCTELSRAEKMYERDLENNLGNGCILEINGSPHCIAYWDATRESDMPGYAELICIHSLPDGWRRGYGSMMMERVLGDIKDAGFGKVMLWVFEDNARAIGFYRKHGFLANGKRKEALGAVEIMYEKEL